MRLSKYPNFHLTYCTNIHPGESWDEVFDQLKSNIPELKSRICPAEPFGIGLRLSAEAAKQLLRANKLESFRAWLGKEDLYVFTMNGFPYGNFHGQRVKDRVYAPDWRTAERVAYTLDLVEILAELLPEELDGGISTSPLSYKYWFDDPSLEEQVFRTGSTNLARIAFEMAQVQDKHGKELHLDIEPEPDCLLENTRETIDFFTEWLLPEGSVFLADEFGLSHQEAREILQNHIRLCYDTCHFAVEYENPSQTITQLQEAGLKIGKTQISAALKIRLEGSATERQAAASRLSPFEESTYLHQVIERRTDGSLHHYRDLSEALPNIYNREAREWRIHYHVPIFMDNFDSMSSTQDDIVRSLQLLRQSGDCRHFEIETYTWEVLPDKLKTNVLDSIEREYQWVLNFMDERA